VSGNGRLSLAIFDCCPLQFSELPNGKVSHEFWLDDLEKAFIHDFGFGFGNRILASGGKSQFPLSSACTRFLGFSWRQYTRLSTNHTVRNSVRSLIMCEISDASCMRVIDLFDLPAYRCLANDSQLLQRHNRDFIIPGKYFRSAHFDGKDF
jgi:hypothetical protein